MKRFFPFGLPLPFYAPDEGGGGGEGQKPDAAAEAAAAAAAAEAAKSEGGEGGQQQQAPNALRDGVADDKGGEVKTPADWPADWREKLAAGDGKRLEQLKRIASPLDLGKSWFDAQGKIRSGQALADEPMPDDPEKAKEWRKARDIPDDPTGYTIPEEITAKLGDEDKPVIASYAEQMHKLGMPQKFVAEGVRWYAGLVEQQTQQQAEDDREAALETRDTLKEEWGADFKANSTIAKRFAEEAIPGVNWFEARLPDGRALGNHPEVVKGLARLGLMEYGDAAFAGGEQATKTGNRIAELEKEMRADFDAWERSPEKRKELFDLIEARDRRAARTGQS